MPHWTNLSTSTTASDVLSADTTTPSSIDDYSLVSRFPGQQRSFVLPTSSTLNASGYQSSTAVSGFSFKESASCSVSPPTSAPLTAQQTQLPAMKEQDCDSQSIRSTKSTRSLKSLKNWRKSTSAKEDTKRRTLFFEDQLAQKDAWDTQTVDQARAISPIIAELRTNVIIKDEYSLVTELSGHFATRYQRPESAVMITIAHSACLMFGGTFEPAYLLTLSAVESYCQPATNKRNTALTQSFLSDVLGVTPDRGVLRFHPIRDDCLATNARTVAGNIEKLEAENNGGVKKAATNGRRKSVGVTSIKRKTTNASEYAALPPEPLPQERKASIANKRKSFMSVKGPKSPDDIKDKSRKNRMSIHPPNINEISDNSSGRSTPEAAAPTYLGSNREPAMRHQDKSPSDQTDGLLSETSRKLSSVNLASGQFGAPPLPQQQAMAAPKATFTNHSRPTSRGTSMVAGGLANKSAMQPHVSQLLHTSSNGRHYQRPSAPQSQQMYQHIGQQQRRSSPQQPQQQHDHPYHHSHYSSRPGTQGTLPPPPAIPDDKPLPQKLSKRKSLISIFKGKS